MASSGITYRAEDGHYTNATSKNVFRGQYSIDSIVVTLSIALSLYNSLELILLVGTTFKKWKGLYFWSLTICNLGVILYALGMMLSYFDLCVQWLHKSVLDLGWVMMVAMQSVVLYSRLHLIVQQDKILSGVKWMIMFNSIVLCTAVVILDFGNVYAKPPGFSKGYYYIEQIQMTIFTIQELVISSIYVWFTIAQLKILSFNMTNTRSVIWQLFTINVIIIVMDLALVVLQYLHYQLYQEALKVFVYSVKLKLELNILSKLVDVFKSNKSRRSVTFDAIDSYAIQGQARTDMHREMAGIPVIEGQVAPRDVVSFVRVRDYSEGSACSSSLPDDGITRVITYNSARTSGRETDHMYAEMLKSMK